MLLVKNFNGTVKGIIVTGEEYQITGKPCKDDVTGREYQ